MRISDPLKKLHQNYYKKLEGWDFLHTEQKDEKQQKMPSVYVNNLT